MTEAKRAATARWLHTAVPRGCRLPWAEEGPEDQGAQREPDEDDLDRGEAAQGELDPEQVGAPDEGKSQEAEQAGVGASPFRVTPVLDRHLVVQGAQVGAPPGWGKWLVKPALMSFSRDLRTWGGTSWLTARPSLGYSMTRWVSPTIILMTRLASPIVAM
jgi:hypothetical protein